MEGGWKAAVGGLTLAGWLVGSVAAGGQEQERPAAVPAAAAPAKVATVTFEFSRPGLRVPRFTLAVGSDGVGTYDAEQAPEATRGGYGGGSGAAVANSLVHRSLVVSPATTASIFAAAAELKQFHAPCASKLKNIADTGAKTVTYAGPEGGGTCSYNYTELKPLAALTTLFQAMAETLDEGRRLDFKHRFDRLGLEAETLLLLHEAEEGRAVELAMIEPELRLIAVDNDVLERVRLRAAKLLERAQAGK